jgi:hypothetical protein
LGGDITAERFFARRIGSADFGELPSDLSLWVEDSRGVSLALSFWNLERMVTNEIE